LPSRDNLRNGEPGSAQRPAISGLVRPGEDRREAVMHLHYGLLAEILVELAKSLASRDQLDEQHRSELSEAAKQLSASLEPRARGR